MGSTPLRFHTLHSMYRGRRKCLPAFFAVSLGQKPCPAVPFSGIFSCPDAVLFLSVFCTGIAFAITAVQQKHTSAVHVGLIFTLEPLFSAIVAFFLAGERLAPRGYVGAALMMLALVTMEAGLPFLKKKKPVEE